MSSRLPATISEEALLARVFPGDGDMARRMRALDWASTPLGPVAEWSQALRTTVGLMLHSTFPMVLWWGPEFIQFYNDTYIPIPGAKHPKALAQRASECWTEIWHIIGPMVEAPFGGAPATTSDDLEVNIDRRGFMEETHFKISYSPVPDETVAGTRVGGVLATVAETTEQVYAQRQLRTLRELGARASEARTPEDACQTAAATFAENPRDVPFALFYLLDADGRSARLAASCGFDAASDANPALVALDAPDTAWPLAEVVRTDSALVLSDLHRRFDRLPAGHWPDSPHTAMLFPLSSPERAHPHGVLIAGCNPHRGLDESYRGFFDLAASQIITAIRNACAYEEQRLRAERLAELDRAKTLFFSNVSHEFRTPLTLMLGPLEEALASGSLADDERTSLDVAHRNGLRLLRLVNTLLDFSRIEAGRADASYEAVDLSALTCDLASVFRSAIERAGLSLGLGCELAAAPVFVDRDMWEKIVLNLLSNAFKYTLHGGIIVSLHYRDDTVELSVKDTGIGIPADDLPRVFDRFHRVRGSEGRTHEGTGIGLALVAELAKLHGGRVGVTSTLGRGSTFTVTLPLGSAHLPQDRLAAEPRLASTAIGAAPFIEEALRWLPESPIDDPEPPPAEVPASQVSTAGSHVLIADDNADMRAYLRRLLEPHWRVETVGDGLQALDAMAQRRPDLVLSDVMMPGLDGLALTSAIRADAALAATPVILLSARAGEDCRVEGLDAGADDYLTKPFSARELIARVNANLELARVRRETLAQQEALTEALGRQKTALEAALAGEPMSTALGLLVEAAEHYFAGGARASIFILDAGGTHLRTAASSMPREYTEAVERTPLGPNAPSCGAAAVTGAPAVVADVGQNPLCQPFELAREHGIGACWSVPIRSAGGRVIGTLAVCHDQPRAAKPREIESIQLLAQTVAMLLERQRSAEAHARAERALRDSEERYRRLVSVLPAAIYTCDAAGRITFYNHHAAQLWGRTPGTGAEEELFCGALRSWRPDGTRLPREQAPMACAIRQGTHYRDEEVVYERPDGSRVTVRVNVDPIRDRDGRLVGAVNVFHDVTASKEGERSLRESEMRLAQRAAQFATLLEHAPIGVMLLDADLRIREVNPVARPMFGDLDELEGRTIDEVVQLLWEPAYAEEVLAILRHTLETGEPFVAPERGERRRDRGVVEYYDWELHRIPRPDGGYGLVSYFRDVSPQIRARDRLATSEERYRSLVSVLTDVPWTTDAQGEFVEPQMAWMAYTGHSWEQHRSRGWLEAIHPDDRASLDAAWRDACETGRPYEARTRMWNAPRREYRHVLARALPLRAPDGRIHEWVGTCTDVHEAQSRADALAAMNAERDALLAITERARAEAETANRAKDEFLAVLSHELRAPLNAMLGWVELLKHTDGSDGMVERAVETLERNVWTQARVIDDLLDVSRITSGKLVLERSRVDLAALVAGVVESMRPSAAAKHLALKLTGSRKPLEVEGDPGRLQQVVGNLLHNAIKYTGEHGAVSVRVKASDGRVTVVVEDTGEGIDAEALPHIFDRFVQSGASTTRRHGGLGLGLAIVKQLAALHGGSVQAASDGPGRGARFTFALPRLEPLVPAVELARPEPPRPRGDISGLDVLLVEDDPDSREALAIAIENRGAHVRLAESAQQALAEFESQAPDLLVSDIGMPGEDGYSLIRRIRERETGGGRHTLAIAMTGFASRHDHETALRAGFDEHVGKPVQLQELFERMRVLASSRAASRGW